MADVPVLDGARRIERRLGEVGRILLALPAPPAEHPDHAGLRLLATLLGGGRTSRLHRAFVDVGQLCLAASCALAEAQVASQLACSFEVLPGGDALEVERRLAEELAALREREIGDEELERGKQILLADWVFQHERIHQQAITAALALAQGDLEQPEKLVRRALECDAAELLKPGAALPRSARRVGFRHLPAGGRVKPRLRRTEGAPVVAVRLLLAGGARCEAIPGQALLTGRLLTEGTSPALAGSRSPPMPRAAA